MELMDLLEPEARECVDLGCGSGILGLYALRKGYCRRVFFIDVAEDALDTVRVNTMLNNASQYSVIVASDKGDALRESTADLVIANPPYLPSLAPDITDIATEGGRHGYEAVLGFIEASSRILKPGGILILVYSSLSSPRVVEEHLARKRFEIVKTLAKSLFFETLYVVGAVRRHD